MSATTFISKKLRHGEKYDYRIEVEDGILSTVKH